MNEPTNRTHISENPPTRADLKVTSPMTSETKWPTVAECESTGLGDLIEVYQAKHNVRNQKFPKAPENICYSAKLCSECLSKESRARARE